MFFEDLGVVAGYDLSHAASAAIADLDGLPAYQE